MLRGLQRALLVLQTLRLLTKHCQLVNAAVQQPPWLSMPPAQPAGTRQYAPCSTATALSYALGLTVACSQVLLVVSDFSLLLSVVSLIPYRLMLKVRVKFTVTSIQDNGVVLCIRVVHLPVIYCIPASPSCRCTGRQTDCRCHCPNTLLHSEGHHP